MRKAEIIIYDQSSMSLDIAQASIIEIIISNGIDVLQGQEVGDTTLAAVTAVKDAAVTDINAVKLSIDTSTGILSTKVSLFSSLLDTLSGYLTTLNGYITSLGAHLSNMATYITNLNTGITNLNAGVANLQNITPSLHTDNVVSANGFCVFASAVNGTLITATGASSFLKNDVSVTLPFNVVVGDKIQATATGTIVFIFKKQSDSSTVQTLIPAATKIVNTPSNSSAGFSAYLNKFLFTGANTAYFNTFMIDEDNTLIPTNSQFYRIYASIYGYNKQFYEDANYIYTCGNTALYRYSKASRIVTVFTGATSLAQEMIYNPNNNYIYVTSASNIIYVFDVATLTQIYILNTGIAGIQNMAVAGTKVFVTCANTTPRVFVWDGITKKSDIALGGSVFNYSILTGSDGNIYLGGNSIIYKINPSTESVTSTIVLTALVICTKIVECNGKLVVTGTSGYVALITLSTFTLISNTLVTASSNFNDLCKVGTKCYLVNYTNSVIKVIDCVSNSISANSNAMGGQYSNIASDEINNRVCVYNNNLAVSLPQAFLGAKIFNVADLI